MRIQRRLPILLWVAAALALVACGGVSSGTTSPTPAADVGSGQLQGAGATFPEPFYTRAFYAYNQKYGQVSVNYQAIGSGGGIQQFTKGTVDFGASDVPMTATEIAAAGGDSTLVQLPTIIGVAAIAYNMPSVSKLQLDGTTLANIFLGTVKKWNDPAIQSLNSGVNLPGTDITVVHRSDGSGTSFAFTDYLSKVSPDWQTKVGKGKSVSWPVGVGASGNQGVGQQVKTTEGSIGYVELAYVIQSQLQYASVKNQAGKYVLASLEGATAAAASLTGVSPTNFSITNAACDACYPITGFSWVMLYTSYSDEAKGKAVVNLFKWLVTDGQNDSKDLEYAPLPTAVQQLALTNLKTIKANGKTVLS